MVIDGSHLSQNPIKQGNDLSPAQPMIMNSTMESFSSTMKGQFIKKLRNFQSNDQKQWKENNSIKKKGNTTAVKEDLSKFLDFYNKSTYMGVAKTMGQKL